MQHSRLYRTYRKGRRALRDYTTLSARSVFDALVHLTSDHRAVVIRAYYMRQSIAELAEELKVPQAIVRRRLHYGLHALRLALQESRTAGSTPTESVTPNHRLAKTPRPEVH